MKKLIVSTAEGKEKKYGAIGRRKTSIARVWLKSGTGSIIVNKEDFQHYFGRQTSRMLILQPFEVVNAAGKFDCVVNVRGGGTTGQAGAIRHGIAKALVSVDPSYRTLLKKAGFLTRDARVVERKKYGRPGARKRFQFSKR